MEKLQKYNQKLLAIIGTLLLVGIAILIITLLVAVITEMSKWSRNKDIQDNSLTLQQVDSSEHVEPLINQDITFENPRLIDTLKTIYLIPISQVNLENKRNGNYEEPILISGSSSKTYRNRRTSYFHYSGEYNNILIYNQQEGIKDFVFDKKIFITDFTNRIIASKHYLLITGATKDSNNDNKLNEDDLKGFYIYDLETSKLRSFDLAGFSFDSFYSKYNTEELLLRYAEDVSKNGEINYLQEPVVIKELDFKTWKLVDFISKSEMERLTKIIN